MKKRKMRKEDSPPPVPILATKTVEIIPQKEKKLRFRAVIPTFSALSLPKAAILSGTYRQKQGKQVLPPLEKIDCSSYFLLSTFVHHLLELSKDSECIWEASVQSKVCCVTVEGISFFWDVTVWRDGVRVKFVRMAQNWILKNGILQDGAKCFPAQYRDFCTFTKTQGLPLPHPGDFYQTPDGTVTFFCRLPMEENSRRYRPPVLEKSYSPKEKKSL